MARIMLSGLLAAWVGTLAEHLHGRNAWRLQRLVVGVILAQGRRTVTSWFRAAGITHGYRSYYYFLAALGLKVQDLGLSLLDLTIQRVPITERLTLALDDTPTKRHGPEDRRGRHGTTTRLPAPAAPRPSTATTGSSWHAWSSTPTRAIIGLPLWASLYVRQCDVPSLPRGVTPWEFQTKLELAATMIQATADSLKGRWDGPVWLLTDGGYAKRPVYAADQESRLGDGDPVATRRPPQRPAAGAQAGPEAWSRAPSDLWVQADQAGVASRSETGLGDDRSRDESGSGQALGGQVVPGDLASRRGRGASGDRPRGIGSVELASLSFATIRRRRSRRSPKGWPIDGGLNRCSTTSRRTNGSGRCSCGRCGRTWERSTWACG